MDGAGEGGGSETGNVDGSGDGEGELLTPEQIDACIRCSPDDGEGTMGFFVCGFVREQREEGTASNGGNSALREEEDEDEWVGFD